MRNGMKSVAMMAIAFAVMVIVLAALVPGAAMASDARIAAMGGNPLIMKDDYNIWLFPNETIDHANLAIAGWGGSATSAILRPRNFGAISGGEYGGTLFRVTDNHAVGLFIDGREEFAAGYPQSADQKLDLFWGGRFSERFSAGLHFGRAASKNVEAAKTGDVQHEESRVARSAIDAGIEIGCTESVAAEIGVSTWFTSWDEFFDDTDLNGREADGYLLTAVRTRVIWAKERNTQLIPYFDFIRDKQAWNEIADGEISRMDETVTSQVNVGIGVNHRPSKSLLLVGSVDAAFYSKEVKFTETGSPEQVVTDDKIDNIPSVAMGFEYRAMKALILRAGAQKRIFDRDLNGAIATGTAFAYNIGAGLKVKDLLLDFVVDTEFARRGPYFISGSGGDFATLVTGTLPF